MMGCGDSSIGPLVLSGPFSQKNTAGLSPLSLNCVIKETPTLSLNMAIPGHNQIIVILINLYIYNCIYNNTK